MNSISKLTHRLATVVAVVALIAAMVGGLAGQATAPPVGSYAPSPTALADIPPGYLRLYEAAGASYGVGWEYLAAIGKVTPAEAKAAAAALLPQGDFVMVVVGKAADIKPLLAKYGTWREKKITDPDF